MVLDSEAKEVLDLRMKNQLIKSANAKSFSAVSEASQELDTAMLEHSLLGVAGLMDILVVLATKL